MDIVQIPFIIVYFGLPFCFLFLGEISSDVRTERSLNNKTCAESKTFQHETLTESHRKIICECLPQTPLLVIVSKLYEKRLKIPVFYRLI